MSSQYPILNQLKEKLLEFHKKRFKMLTGKELQTTKTEGAAPPSTQQETQEPQIQLKDLAAVYGQLKHEKKKIAIEL